jgi:hypothetical protein
VYEELVALTGIEPATDSSAALKTRPSASIVIFLQLEKNNPRSLGQEKFD